MKCKGCGREIDGSTKFCKYCGRPVEKSADVPVQKMSSARRTRCPKCGAELKPSDKFCTKCGASVPNRTVERNRAVKRQESEKRNPEGNKVAKILIAVSLIITVILIVVIVLYLFGFIQNGSGAENTRQVQTSAEETSEEDETEIESTAAPEESTAVIAETVQESETETAGVNAEVEAAATLLTERYDEITSKISSDSYELLTTESGMLAYYNGTSLVAAVFPKGTENSAYSCSYYYDNGDLFFACYEGTDSHKFYFRNGEMIRWRYAQNSSDSSNVEDHDEEETAKYIQWEKSVLASASQAIEEWNYAMAAQQTTAAETTAALPTVAATTAAETTAAVSAETNQELLYFIEHADSEYFSEDYFTGFDKATCRLARNGVYARMGRMFKDETLSAYFSQFSWYQPTISADDFKESSLNKYQKKNLKVVVAYEKKMGYR